MLAPVSLMVLNIDKKDNNKESTRDAFEHPIDPHSIPNPQQDDAIRGSNALPNDQSNPPRGQAPGYPRHNMRQYRQEFDMKRPQNPVGSTLNSCESDFNETTLRGHKDKGPEPDTDNHKLHYAEED